VYIEICQQQNSVLTVCRRQRALLKVLSKVDSESCHSDDSTRRSTAWTDDNEACTVSESVSCASLANSSMSVMGVRTSLSAGDLNSESAAVKQSGSSGTRHRTDRRSARNQVPAGDISVAVEKHSTKNSSHSRHGAVRQSRTRRSRRQPITVDIELLSNWGHERLVGLTEIELFDASVNRIDVDPSTDVTVSAAGPVNDIHALFNGKCKV